MKLLTTNLPLGNCVIKLHQVTIPLIHKLLKCETVLDSSLTNIDIVIQKGMTGISCLESHMDKDLCFVKTIASMYCDST